MLTKFYVALSIFLAKVPHAILATALVISIWGPKLIALMAGTQLAPFITDANDVVTFAIGILNLAKQFNPTTEAAKESDKGIVAKAKSAVTVPPLAMLCFGGLLALLCSGCSPAANQTALNTIPADLTDAICITERVEIDIAAKMTPEAIAADLLTTCGPDTVTILNTVDGYNLAMEKVGKRDHATTLAIHVAFRSAALAKGGHK